MSTSASPQIVGLSALVAVFMIAQQIASKAVRDGFFLSQLDVTALPVATLAAAVVSFAAALFLGKLMATFSPAAAVPVLFAANGMLFFAEALLITRMPRAVASGLYLHTAAFGGAVVSGFWSVINERFDPYTAKKVVGRIAGGATFGGVLGGALTWMFSDVAPRFLLVGFGVSSLLCAAAVAWVARGGQQERTAREPAALLSGVKVLVDNAYPRALGIVVFLVALMTGTVDYVFKAGVAEGTPEASLVGFFAVFYTVTGVATFVVQALGSRRILKWLGVVLTVGLLPVVALGLLGLALLLPGMLTLVLLRGGAMVVENSLYRSGYELLYTAVPREQKRSAKVLIDLGCDRLGTAAASGLALLVIGLASLAVDRMLLLTALLVALAVAGVLVVVRSEYVASLANQLRRALPSMAPGEESSAMALASTFVADLDIWPSTVGGAGDPSGVGSRSGTRPMDRNELLVRVRERAAQKDASVPAEPMLQGPAPLPVSRVSEQLLSTPLRARLREAGPSDPELRQSAPATIGQLGDILLSRREDAGVRLGAIELLATVPSQRAAAALLEILNAPELRLRRAGALALHQICTVLPALRPPRRTLTEVAAAELRRPSRPLGVRNAFEQSSPFRQDARGNELAPTLEIILLLLAIRGDTAELRLALAAITSEDPVRRGTGLEYLDNLLPGNLRARLLALVENPELTQADQRVSQRIVQRLAAELRAGEIGVRELRRRFRQARKEQYDQRS